MKYIPSEHVTNERTNESKKWEESGGFDGGVKKGKRGKTTVTSKRSRYSRYEKLARFRLYWRKWQLSRVRGVFEEKKNFNIFNRSQLSSNFCDFIFSSSLRCIITNTLYVSSMQSHRYKTNKLNWKSYEYRDTILPQDLRSLVNVISLFFSLPNTDYFISKTPSK